MRGIHPLRPAGDARRSGDRRGSARASGRRCGSASAARGPTSATAPTPGARMQDEFRVYGRPASRATAAARRSRRPVPAAAAPGTARPARPSRPRPRDYTRERGPHLQDRGGRAPLDPVRGGGPDPPPLHGRPRADRRDRQGRPQDDVALRRAARAARATSSSMLHQGGGELHTVTGVELVRPHSAAREDPYRLAVGLIGAEAMLRLFTEQEANERAFGALDALPRPARRARPAAPGPSSTRSASSFQLKLLWLSGYLPHVEGCAECGSRRAARRLLGESGRNGVHRLRCRLPRALRRRARGDDGASAESARRRAGGRTDGAGRPRDPRGDDVLVRGARRLPAPDGARGMSRRLDAERVREQRPAG